MFEQAVLENSYGNRRAFATGAGFAGQAALAACIVIAPMIWPQVLPRPRLTMMVTPPAPSPPEPIAAARPRETHSATPLFRREITIPSRMPALAKVLVDPLQSGEPPTPGVIGGISNGPSTTGVLDGILKSVVSVAKPPAPATQAKAPVEEVKRITVSSLDPGRLIHLVEPVYPSIAKTAHISGTVELQAVIGADGRVRELKVISGHVLLRNAALEAVRQWVYKPPVLNGAKVELVAPIAVIFRLN